MAAGMRISKKGRYLTILYLDLISPLHIYAPGPGNWADGSHNEFAVLSKLRVRTQNSSLHQSIMTEEVRSCTTDRFAGADTPVGTLGTSICDRSVTGRETSTKGRNDVTP